jgi:hypothetical protein
MAVNNLSSSGRLNKRNEAAPPAESGGSQPSCGPSVVALDRCSLAFVGLFDELGFEAARSMIGELRVYSDYSDWLDVRQGAEIGLAMAGIRARMVPVDFDQFISWCEAVKLRPSEAALDAYAMTIARKSPDAPLPVN